MHFIQKITSKVSYVKESKKLKDLGKYEMDLTFQGYVGGLTGLFFSGKQGSPMTNAGG